MRKSIPGLLLGLCAVLLMLGAMVSSPKEKAPEASAKLPAAPCAVCPAQPARAAEEGAPVQNEGPRFRRAADTALPGLEQVLPACPSADANGVPLLTAVYRHSNYRAFRFSDEAG